MDGGSSIFPLQKKSRQVPWEKREIDNCKILGRRDGMLETFGQIREVCVCPPRQSKHTYMNIHVTQKIQPI